MEAELFAEQDERSAPSGRALTALQITQADGAATAAPEIWLLPFI